MKDLHNNIHPSGVECITVTDTTAIVSGIIDTQGYNSHEFIIATGILADVDATFTVLIEDGDDSGLTDNAPVADSGLLGTEALAGFTFAEDNTARKIGYIGNKRYIRCTVTPVANTGSAPIAIIALQGNPNNAPTANPPA